MIRSLVIDGFRGFPNYELHNLGRVNLIVGNNNSGKTSVLEALNIAFSDGNAAMVWNCAANRGETVDVRENNSLVKQIDVRKLFNGFGTLGESEFQIHAIQNENQRIDFTAQLKDIDTSNGQSFSPLETNDQNVLSNVVEATSTASLFLGWSREKWVRYSMAKGYPSQIISHSEKIHALTPSRVLFTNGTSLNPNYAIQLFEKIVLTSEENVVIEALNIIDDKIERLATSGAASQPPYRSSPGQLLNRSNIIIKRKDSQDRIPIGSLGDGIWRILGIILALISAKDGTLLIDEIDSGLHYSVMEKMWDLIVKTAQRLNVQVFATTHSRDCIDSLASVCRAGVKSASEITIQRIDRIKKVAVSYSEDQIINAAKHGTEVR